MHVCTYVCICTCTIHTYIRSTFSCVLNIVQNYWACAHVSYDMYPFANVNPYIVDKERIEPIVPAGLEHDCCKAPTTSFNIHAMLR